MENFDDGQLIELVQQFSLIWDKKHPDHKNKLKLENAWSTIAEIMGARADLCEQRWTNIRHRFAKERRMAQRPSGSASYTISWPHYSACLFLENVVVPRKTTSNIKLTSPTPSPGPSTVVSGRDESKRLWDSTQDMYAECEVEIQDTEDESVQLDKGSPPQLSEAEESRPGPSRLSLLRRDNISKKRKRTDTEEGPLSELTSTILTAFKDLKSLTESTENKNEDFVFGKAVAVMLKDVTGKKKKAMLKAKIIELIAQATDDE